MPIVRFSHPSQLFDIVPQRVALAARQMIVVDYLLNVSNSVVQIALVESAVLPVPGEIAKLVFSVIEALTVAVPQVPNPISTVEIGMYALDKRGNRFRPVAAIGRPKLGVRNAYQHHEHYAHH
jgi:hypothetical protein